MVKNPPTNAGDIRDAGSIPGSGRSPGRGHGNSLQYSFPDNPMDRGAWRASVHGVAKRWTGLKRLAQHTYIYTRRERELLREETKDPEPVLTCCFQIFTSPALVFTTKCLTTVRSVFQASVLAGFSH